MVKYIFGLMHGCILSLLWCCVIFIGREFLLVLPTALVSVVTILLWGSYMIEHWNDELRRIR